MPTEEEIQARIDAAVVAEREKNKSAAPPTSADPGPVAALMRSEAAAIAKACADGGVPGITSSLLAEGLTLAQAQARIGQAGTIKDMVALARAGTPTIPADFADTMIGAGKTVEGVRAELFNQMVARGAGSADDGARSFHRAGAGSADHPGGSSAATARARGKALMADEVRRQGMTPRTGA